MTAADSEVAAGVEVIKIEEGMMTLTMTLDEVIWPAGETKMTEKAGTKGTIEIQMISDVRVVLTIEEGRIPLTMTLKEGISSIRKMIGIRIGRDAGLEAAGEVPGVPGETEETG